MEVVDDLSSSQQKNLNKTLVLYYIPEEHMPLSL